MVFTMLGLVAAMLFGVFFDSKGELPAEIQDAVFMYLIVGGASLHGLQIVLEKVCDLCHCRFCGS